MCAMPCRIKSETRLNAAHKTGIPSEQTENNGEAMSARKGSTLESQRVNAKQTANMPSAKTTTLDNKRDCHITMIKKQALMPCGGCVVGLPRIFLTPRIAANKCLTDG